LIQIILIAIVLIDFAVLTVVRTIEAVLYVVKPDNVSTQQSDYPEAASISAVGLLRPLFWSNFGSFPQAALRGIHPSYALGYFMLKMFTRYWPPSFLVVHR
jgi:hypothetical protein